jgi:hypothetical protein
MFRNGRLFHPEARHDVSDRTLLDSQIIQNVPPARLGNCIKSI